MPEALHMVRMVVIVILVSVMGCGSGSASSAIPSPAGPTGGSKITRTPCDSLQGPQKERAENLLTTLYIYDCCDEKLALCLQYENRCLLAVRLAENICRRVARGQDDDSIKLALTLRARTMQSKYMNEAVDIDLSGVPMVGDPDAPISVVGYTAPRGIQCARLTPLIHDAIVNGRLKGKARLSIKPFPRKINPHSKEAGLAFLAAQELGGFWEFVLYSYAYFDSFTTSLQPQWAEAVGLDREKFEKLIEDSEILQRLAKGKMEGLENGVESTPAYFINGNLYKGEVEFEEIVDVIEEMYDQSQGRIHEQ